MKKKKNLENTRVMLQHQQTPCPYLNRTSSKAIRKIHVHTFHLPQSAFVSCNLENHTPRDKDKGLFDSEILINGIICHQVKNKRMSFIPF